MNVKCNSNEPLDVTSLPVAAATETPVKLRKRNYKVLESTDNKLLNSSESELLDKELGSIFEKRKTKLINEAGRYDDIEKERQEASKKNMRASTIIVDEQLNRVLKIRLDKDKLNEELDCGKGLKSKILTKSCDSSARIISGSKISENINSTSAVSSNVPKKLLSPEIADKCSTVSKKSEENIGLSLMFKQTVEPTGDKSMVKAYESKEKEMLPNKCNRVDESDTEEDLEVVTKLLQQSTASNSVKSDMAMLLSEFLDIHETIDTHIIDPVVRAYLLFFTYL